MSDSPLESGDRGVCVYIIIYMESECQTHRWSLETEGCVCI